MVNDVAFLFATVLSTIYCTDFIYVHGSICHGWSVLLVLLSNHASRVQNPPKMCGERW